MASLILSRLVRRTPRRRSSSSSSRRAISLSSSVRVSVRSRRSSVARPWATKASSGSSSSSGVAGGGTASGEAPGDAGSSGGGAPSGASGVGALGGVIGVRLCTISFTHRSLSSRPSSTNPFPTTVAAIPCTRARLAWRVAGCFTRTWQARNAGSSMVYRRSPLAWRPGVFLVNLTRPPLVRASTVTSTPRGCPCDPRLRQTDPGRMALAKTSCASARGTATSSTSTRAMVSASFLSRPSWGLNASTYRTRAANQQGPPEAIPGGSAGGPEGRARPAVPINWGRAHPRPGGADRAPRPRRAVSSPRCSPAGTAGARRGRGWGPPRAGPPPAP